MNHKKTINEDGMVWIHNQKIFVKNSSGEGIPPTVMPSEGIELVIDGKVCNHLTMINKNSNIEVKSINETIEPKIEIEVTPDKMYAFLKLSIGKKISIHIKDVEPQNCLLVEADKDIITFNNLQEEQIIRELDKLGIVFGIKKDLIKELVESKEDKKVLIAEGINSIPGTDSFVDFIFQNSNTLYEDENGKVDYRNISAFEYVKENEIIAILHEEVEGTCGKDIFGNVVLPKKPRRVKLIAGNGITIDNNGLEARALIFGIPNIIEKGDNYTIEILKVLEINQDIDLNTGNIKHSDDILINGNIKENMSVTSLSKILLRGSIYFSTIAALDKITIEGNAISSKLTCGINCIEGNEFFIALKDLYNDFSIIEKKAFDHVENDLQNNEVGMFLKHIINLKYKDFPKKIFDFYVKAKKNEYGLFSNDALEIFERFKLFLLDVTKFKYLSELNELDEVIVSKLDKCNTNNAKSRIILNHASNSEIICDGDVKVVKKGCYNSKIYAKENVSICGSFIGGEIYSDKFINLEDVGTEVGIKVLLKTSANGKIYARKVFSGTVLIFGNVGYEFEEDAEMIRASLQDDKIVLR